MSKSRLQEELNIIEAELSKLDARRTAIIHHLMGTPVLGSGSLDPDCFAITETIYESDAWPPNPRPKSDGRP